MNSRISSYFFFVLLFGAVVATLLIFLPFLTPIVLAIAGAVLAHPIQRFFARKMGDGGLARTTASLITVLLVTGVIIVPVFFLVGGVYAEIQTLYASLTDEGNRSQLIQSLNTASIDFSNLVFGALPAHSFDTFNVTTYIKSALATSFANLDAIFSSMAKIVGYALVFLLALFYLLRDGSSLKKLIISWSPLLDSNDVYITYTFKRAIRSVFAGTFVVSILEGLSVGFAFWVFGIPAPALWGVVAAVASMVPGFGTSLLILPATAYLILTGDYTFAAGLFIWGYAGIIIIDHIIGPNLINRGVKVHPFLVLLSVLGGLLMFGLIGLVLGPLVLVFLFTLLEIYKTSFIDPAAKAGIEGQSVTDNRIL